MGSKSLTLTCWICGRLCELEGCRVDERGRAVHAACYLERLLAVSTVVQPTSRHECVIYEGAPSRTLSALSDVAQQKLKTGYRCLYLNSPVMVAGMKSSLAAKGVDVAEEISKGSLVLSAEQGHLVDGHFCVEGMIQTLEATLLQARKDGYKDLWATGDMTWEFGPLREFATILQYEWRLEEFFRTHPDLYGICQYHRDTLPAEVVHNGLLSHRSIFINETLSRINPFYVPPESFTEQTRNHGYWEHMISNVCQS